VSARRGNIYLSINNVLEEVLATINFDHHGWSSMLRGQCRLLVRLLKSEMEYFGKCPFIDARALAEEHLEDIVYEEIVRGYTKWQAGGHSSTLGAGCGISVAIDKACTIYAD
jgi:hypothetical protein